MPRVNIHVHDIDEIEELEEQEDWELQLGLAPAEPRREVVGSDSRNRTAASGVSAATRRWIASAPIAARTSRALRVQSSKFKVKS